MEQKKKTEFLPKIQKKIRSFLSDESGKITKKDALGISLLGALSSVPAITEAGNWGHANGGHFNGNSDTVSGARANVTVTGSCSHLSGLVYGHLNQNYPAPSAGIIAGHGSHSSY